MEKRKRREGEEKLNLNNTHTDDTIITTTNNTTKNRLCLEWRSSRLEKEEESSYDDECGETIERYSRQMRLPVFHENAGGQSRLLRASVFIAGAGGLGCPSLLYLAGAGVGFVTVCDEDTVEKSNLHRQICHRNEDCCSENKEGRTKTNKAISAIRAAKSLNPTCAFRAVEEAVNEQNAMELLRDADVVLDCTDNQRARYVLSDACAKLRTPLVSGASVGVEGQLVVYNESGKEEAYDGCGDAERGPCLRCAYPSPPPADECGSCAEQGVLNVAPGIVGTFQALECIRILLSGRCRYRGKEGENKEKASKSSLASSSTFPHRPLGLMTLFDFVQNPSRPTTCVKIKRRKDCLVCATSETRDAFAIESYDYDAFLNGGIAAQRCTNNGTDNKIEESIGEDGTQRRITCEELAQLLVENSNKKKNNSNTSVASHEQKHHEKTKSVVLFDVRNEIEFSIAALKDAINYPFVDEENEKNAMETMITTNVVVATVDEDGGEEEEKAVTEVEVDVIAFICRRGNDSQLARERFKQKLLDGDESAKNKRRTLTIEDGSDTTQTKKKFCFDVEKCQIVDVIGGLRQWKRAIDSTFPNLD